MHPRVGDCARKEPDRDRKLGHMATDGVGERECRRGVAEGNEEDAGISTAREGTARVPRDGVAVARRAT